MDQKFEYNYSSSNQFAHGFFYTMHTRIDLLLFDENDAICRYVFDAIYKDMNYLNSILNRFDPNSELAQINHNAYKRSIYLNDDLVNILTDCIRYNQLTNGLFDISINSLSKQEVGLKHLILNEKEKTLQFGHPDLKLDLGGYAKGFALERAKYKLQQENIANAFLSFGNSSILAWGHHPHGDCWKVGVASLFNSGKPVLALDLKDTTFSTSGNLLGHLPHIKSPKTDQFMEKFITASVLADSAIDSEVLSTVLLLTDSDVESHEILSRFTFRSAYIIDYEESRNEPKICVF